MQIGTIPFPSEPPRCRSEYPASTQPIMNIVHQPQTTKSVTCQTALLTGRLARFRTEKPLPTCPRINNTTCVLLKKWHQQSVDFFRVSLHVGKGREQRLAQRGGPIELPVVGAFLPGVMPEPLRGIEIRRIRGGSENTSICRLCFAKNSKAPSFL